MPARRRVVDLAAARGRHAVLELGRELDLAVRNLGLSYAAVGRDVGLSAVQVARVAHGTAPSLTILQASELLGAVGMELSIRAFPVGGPLRDTAHLRLLDRFRARLHRSLSWRTEVAVGGHGDLRAWDGMVGSPAWRYGVEAETRIRDWQALERRIALKLRDGTADGVILVIRSSRENTLALRQLGDALRASFPVPSRRVLALLGAGVNPGGSGLVLL